MTTLLGGFPRFTYTDQLSTRQDRKNRTVQSCTECRRRKAKCDRKFPCGPCTQRGSEAHCVEYQRIQPEGLTGYTLLKDFDALASRVFSLETFLTQYASSADPSAYSAALEAYKTDTANNSFSYNHASPPGGGVGAGGGSGIGGRAVRFSERERSESEMMDGEGGLGGGYPGGEGSDEDEDSDGEGNDGTNNNGKQRSSRRSLLLEALQSQGSRPPLPQPIASSSKLPVPTYDQQQQEQQHATLAAAAAASHLSSSAGGAGPGSGLGSRQYYGFNDSKDHSEAVSRAPSLVEHDAALYLEDVVYERNVMRNTKQDMSHFDEKISPMTIDTALAQSSMGIPQANDRSNGGGAGVANIFVQGLTALPAFMTASFVMNYFLQEVEWLFRCLHIPTFLEQLQAFRATSGPMNPMTRDQAGFLALYSACLCTALHMMDDETLLQTGHTQETRTVVVNELSDLVEMTLVKVDWSGNPRLDTLQAFIIIGPYWSSINRSESHLALLGTAIRVAQNLGLSRLGPELPAEANADEVKKRFGSRWVMASDREVGRRIWWTLIELDWNASLEHQFHYSASIDQNHTIEPANINDEDLREYGPVISLPNTSHTGMSFVLNRLQFLHGMRDFVKSVARAGRLKYDLVLHAHSVHLDSIQKLSPFYRLNADVDMDPELWATDAKMLQKMIREKYLVNQHGHFQILRLHRFYLSSSYRFRKYSFSRDAAIRSARFLLDHSPATTSLPPQLLRYWPIAQSILSATIILLVTICHAARFETHDFSVLVRQGIKSLRLFRGASAMSRSAEMLQRVLDIEMATKAAEADSSTFKDYALGKRKRSEGDIDSGKFGRLIEKVLVTSQDSRPSASRQPSQTIYAESSARDIPQPSLAFPDNLPSTSALPQGQTSQQSEFDSSWNDFDFAAILGETQVSLQQDDDLMELLKWMPGPADNDAFWSQVGLEGHSAAST